LTPLLQRARHAVVAVDLPSEDGSAGFDDYSGVVCAALTDHDDVVLMGHSFGG
jgi:Alpha/beta hydrolase family